MNKTQYLLTKLGEEGAEISQATTKAAHFGLDDVWPERGITNLEMIEREVNDLMGTLEALREHGVEIRIRPELIAMKRAKIAKWLRYAVETGNVIDEPAVAAVV